MSEYETIVGYLLKSDSNISAVAIIEGKNNVVYSTGDWDFDNEIKVVNTNWENEDAKSMVISGQKYFILQRTPERFIAIAFEKTKRKIISTESIVGFKDDEREMLCKVPRDGMRIFALSETAKAVRKLSSKETYLDPSVKLGKARDINWYGPKIVFDSSSAMQKVGLQRFGLSLDEAKVYLELLKKGDEGEKVGNLNKQLDIKRTTIYQILDRLIGKEWVEKEPTIQLLKTIKSPKEAQRYVAKPIIGLLDEKIKQKEEEIKVLKNFRLLMEEGIESSYVSAISEDFGIKGLKNECGLSFFVYDRSIETEKIVIRTALKLYSEKIKHDIESREIPALEDIKFEEKEVMDYAGGILFLKFKDSTESTKNYGSNWLEVVKIVAIPINNKIYVIWGGENKFRILKNLILSFK